MYMYIFVADEEKNTTILGRGKRMTKNNGKWGTTNTKIADG